MKRISSLLMNRDQYKQTSIKAPYFFSIKNNGQVLFYFGARHSRDPKDPQFNLLRKKWDEFLKLTKGKERIVFNEGGPRFFAESEGNVIRNDGEAGFITFIASKGGVTCRSPEPPDSYHNKLLGLFSKEEIQYSCFANYVYQWHSFDPKPDFKEYIERYLHTDRRFRNWPNFDFSLENMKKIHTEIFGGEFDENHKEFFYLIIRPDHRTTVINKISEQQSMIRDEYIIKEIVKYWGKRYSLFVVFGFSHAVVQEPALEKLLV